MLLPIDHTRDKIRQRTSKLRAVYRVIMTKGFATAFAEASEADRSEVEKISTPRELRDWLARVTKKPLTALSYRELRDRGRAAHIANYSRLTKDELIACLEKLNEGQLGQSQQPARGVQAVPAAGECPGASGNDADAAGEYPSYEI